ncbi:alpha/beta hydrolase [Saccharopolyspora spinosa]|uniref:S-formylglutathione hydrolase FrmB n=1 Tax=Saccharopolyspora spinosa TaxID=60894 RepID=A0A2N3Y131_SACSN|nr:alpha/beta hydrolase-fold protein [Saccharopolyspora spinosa]PKW16551.1 S-formylglutathione hydrolase FrmB [Saccharopolyspora spinosa]
METRTETWHSAAIGRPKSVTIALPPGYSRTGRPFQVVYLLHSFGGNRHSWLSCPRVAEHAARHRLILVLPESGRAWFINDDRGRRYEDYLVGEVVLRVDARFNTVADRTGRAVAGFSMGGAAAVFQTLRHSDVFSVAGSNSGAFGAARRVGDPYHRHRGDRGLMMPTERDHERVWGPPGSRVRRRYDPRNLLVERDRTAPLAVYLDVGLGDFERMIAMNRAMREELLTHGVPHEYRERPGGHDWRFVDAGAEHLLGFVRAHLA